MRMLRGLGRWITATKLRTAIAGGVGMLGLATMFTVWSLLAHVAVDSLTPVSIASAFVALDEGRFDDARAVVAELQDQPVTTELLSGALFVLGASKAQEAAEESTSERSRSLHELAARYLVQALERDLSPLRRRQGTFLLGKSQVLGGQAETGIETLEKLLESPSPEAAEIHSLLTKAYLELPSPQLAAALRHNESVLADSQASPEFREAALTIQPDVLMKEQRFDDARRAIDQIPVAGPRESFRQLLLGRLQLGEAGRLSDKPDEREPLLQEALKFFAAAQKLDGNRGVVSRQAMLWRAQTLDALQESDAAIEEYDRIGKLFGDHPEAFAATLALAEHRLQRGDVARAVEEFRSVLGFNGESSLRGNGVLPREELRRRFSAAYAQLIAAGNFAESIELAELLQTLMAPSECVEMRAKALDQWGTAQLVAAARLDAALTHRASQEGREHLRSAGCDFERLAQMRYSSRVYTDDLWTAADCFFRGQSYTNAERVLQTYLHEESRKGNALALLRLGQCRLARRQFDEAIAALEECIELYPADAMTFQARLECARAYEQSGKLDRAEQLLQSNLAADRLNPKSDEWRDSQFDLGRLFYESQRYEDAIRTLDEAVQRYPDAKQALLAKYTIARAYHGAAEGPAQKLKEVKTDNERQKNRKLLTDNLEGALEAYVQVQKAMVNLRGLDNLDPLNNEILLNCYMMQGAVLYELRRFEEARQVYGNVVTLYENQPIVLESLVQSANCWRQLDQPEKARVTLQRAQLALKRLPAKANYLSSTNFDRSQWESIIDQMSKW